MNADKTIPPVWPLLIFSQHSMVTIFFILHSGIKHPSLNDLFQTTVILAEIIMCKSLTTIVTTVPKHPVFMILELTFWK